MSSVVGGDASPSLFQIHEPRRRFLLPFLGVLAVHVGLVVWGDRQRTIQPRPAPERVKLVLRLPVRKVAVNEPPGGGPRQPPAPARPHRVRRPLRTPKEIPLPVVEPPVPPPEPPALAEAEEVGDTEEGAASDGPGQGGGSGTGSGPGVGPGHGSVASKARKAWVSHTDWHCRRPGNEDLGRIVVRIHVEVQPNGHPGQVSVVKPGPDVFNRRAIDCARDETYLPALDPEGRPIPGDCEFGIEFIN
jgi:hypothetical protein